MLDSNFFKMVQLITDEMPPKNSTMSTHLGPFVFLFFKLMDLRFKTYLAEKNIDPALVDRLPGETVLDLKRRGIMRFSADGRRQDIAARLEDPDVNEFLTDAVTTFRCLNNFSCPILRVPLGKYGLDRRATTGFAAVMDWLEANLKKRWVPAVLKRLFDCMLHRFCGHFGGASESADISGPLRRLAVSLAVAGKQPGELLRVYDPCPGAGELLSAWGCRYTATGVMPPEYRTLVFGQNRSVEMRSLCQMNLALHGLNHDKILERDGYPWEKDLFEGEQADVVMTAPLERRTLHFMLVQMMEHLVPGGRGLMFLPADYFTDRDECGLFVSLLCEQGESLFVVLLPEGVVDGWSGTTVLLVFTRAPKGRHLDEEELRPEKPELQYYDIRGDIDVQSIRENIYSGMLDALLVKYELFLNQRESRGEREKSNNGKELSLPL